MTRRKDNKKRVLRKGEGQKSDGRYYFKYKDTNGHSHFVYSWKLEPHDIPPVGKESELSLRELERQIIRNVEDGILGYDSRVTVLDLVRLYIQQKVGVRHNTHANYNFVINIIKTETFGSMLIGRVKPSDAKRWLIKLQKDGRGYSTIHTIRGVVRPAFQMAVEDDMLNKNPFQFELASVVVNNSVTRKAISHEEQRKFLEFVAHDKHFSRYYDGIYILFNTGLRISEFVGLTLKDIDVNAKRLTVDHQLQRKRNMEYIIEKPKTAAGSRVIPISDEVCAAFKRIIAKRPKPKVEPMIDGHAGFLYLDKNGQPMVALHWEKYFQHICEKYNSIHKIALPKITPPCVLPYLLQQYGTLRHESQDIAILDGSLGYQCNAQYLYPYECRDGRGGTEKDEYYQVVIHRKTATFATFTTFGDQFMLFYAVFCQEKEKAAWPESQLNQGLEGVY